MRTIVLVAFLALVAAACGDDGAVTAPDPPASAPDLAKPTTATTTAPPTGEPQLQASCGGVLLEGGAVPILPEPPLDAEAAAAVAEVVEFLEAEDFIFLQSEWALVSRADAELTLFGRTLVDPGPGGPEYTYAVLEQRDGGWRPSSWGQCRIEVAAPGFGNATWVVDPDVPPDPSSTRLAIWINEGECASGEPPVGRTIVPVVAMDTYTAADGARRGGSVTITVLVEPVGEATCPSNPWYPIVVDLPEPLGDRPLFDGSKVPSLLRPWPPTDASIDSLGTEQ